MRAADALATLPDEPRWLEARAMLLGGAVPWAAGAGWVVADEAAELLVASAEADVASVLAAARGLTVLCALERADLADALRARGPVSRAVLHTLDDPSWLPDDEGAYPLPADTDLGHLPGP